ncbi:ATP-binding protein [Catellatospora coxensis]|uniref:ATP-binding protein n=1 Tax=Catellatospora coxensis TaxID=310354 RepID=UPI001942FB74|nr:ATP-binding protein [Catellatospora coxensis]
MLVVCEKLLVEHLAIAIGRRSGRSVIAVDVVSSTARESAMTGGRRQQQLAALHTAVREAKPRDLIVVPNLDLLAGGTDMALSAEARELTDVLYDRNESVLLGFVDPSLVIPEVLANRFAVRLAIDLLPRELVGADGAKVPVGQALVTAEEAALFAGFSASEFYKHIAGMNAVRMRHGVRFAYQRYQGSSAVFEDLVTEVRNFKAATSASFDLPNVSFEEIGGYEDIRRELERAVHLINHAEQVPEKFRHELVPRGYIFHGPPGTGKTLFAKAVATSLKATILVVSGPEVTDMYVGESERKVRDLFAEARRNAPAVIVFDEFDSIAGRRSGREDGGSRAGNAIVAQLLTELDGFRPEVPVLVIGTTNRLDIIDDALLRPSRFRPIHIDLPTTAARRRIAQVHAGNFEVTISEELLDHLAGATERMNGDEIRSVFRDAKADEVLGNPPRAADARRLGELVGTLRRTAQDRDLSRSVPSSRVSSGTGRPAGPTTTLFSAHLRPPTAAVPTTGEDSPTP